MAAIDTVLFDFDGTVMDTNDVIIGSWQHTFRTVEGAERPVEEIIKTFGEPLAVTMAKVLPQIPVEEGVEIYREHRSRHFADMIRPFPGVADLLAGLKAMNKKLGLVTSRIGETTRQGLAQFGLLDYFDCIITCDDTDKHKPDPAPLLLALERLGSKVETSLMVGDSMFDIESAKNAGMESVLVGWQVVLTDEEIKGPMGPTHVILKPEDLLALLGGGTK